MSAKNFECDDENLSYLECREDDVIISGMSGIFPESRDIYEFRDNLFNKVDMVTDETRILKQTNSLLPQKSGKIRDCNKFDAGFFGITRTQTDCMEPLFRMGLQEAVKAIVDAGYNPSDFENSRTAVLSGSMTPEVERRIYNESQKKFCDEITGSSRTMLSERISHALKLEGPTTTGDTACSTSLYIFEHGYSLIKSGRCDKALICGGTLNHNPNSAVLFRRMGALSADGICKSFDDSADGYGRSDAMVVVLLERAKDAKRVYCKVINTKVNCDGYKIQGITYPSWELQSALLEEVYEESKIHPAAVTFLEGHVTGTPVGDPEELKTIEHVYCNKRDKPLYTGSVKSNIGHTEPASGLCSLIKLLISMETGFIPPNLHYNTPRRGIEILQNGKLHVVTEKTPLPDDIGIFALNNFGFGGANGHAVLHWNPKTKISNRQPSDNLPRLICVSSRVPEGVDSILEDYKTKYLDAEYAYLIHQIFRKPFGNNNYRGYGVYTRQGEVRRSLCKFDGIKRSLNMIFTNFGEEWSKISHDLLQIPVFAKTMKCVHDILFKIVHIDLYGILNYEIQDDSISQSLGTTILQIALANILKEINLVPNEIIGFDVGTIAALYVNGKMNLREAIVSAVSKAPLKKGRHEKAIFNGNGPKNGIDINDDGFNEHSKSISTNIKNMRHIPADDVILVVIGAETETVSQNSLLLIDVESKNYIHDFLSNLGRLYEIGYEMELDKLYPSIQLPVSRSTPMLSPLIKWHHTKSYNIHQVEATLFHPVRATDVIVNDMEWSFILGHVVDGRNLFPATGYLVLAWETFASLNAGVVENSKVVFERVKFIRATHLRTDKTTLVVMILASLNYFEVSEGGTVVVTGYIYDNAKADRSTEEFLTKFDEKELVLTEKDVYKELKIRGYHYSGLFKAIKKCNLDGSQAVVQWEANWISFLDGLVQSTILKKDSRNLYVPTSIDYLSIDAPRHLAAAALCDNMFQVNSCPYSNVLRSGGVEIRGIGANAISRRKPAEPVLETYKFIANEATLAIDDSIQIFVQVILENSKTVQVKVVEVLAEDKNEDDLLCPIVRKSLEDMPLMKHEMVVLSRKPIQPANLHVKNVSLESESNALILILTNILESKKVSTALNVISGVKGFIISRENLQTDLSKFDASPLQVLCSYKTEKEILVLLRQRSKVDSILVTLDVSDPLDKFEWIPKLQNILKESNKVVLFTQNNDTNGLLGLINCLRREEHTDKLFAVCIMDEAPVFNIKLDFYQKQLEKKLVLNVWKDKSWGTYRHLPLAETPIVKKEHCYVNAGTLGDLSSLKWFEGNIDRGDSFSSELELVEIYYASLNFRDLMVSSGKLPVEGVTTNRIEQECVFGLEFAGRTSKGRRVMGTAKSGAMSSRVLCHKNYLLNVPDSWSMEEAATIPAVYSTVIQAIVGDVPPKAGESILIHSGTGGTGLAAINVSLYYGLTIFVTVGTKEKRNYIKTNYPQIKEEHIGYSRDTSFEIMIEKYTGGRGVDLVLNSLSEEKLLASVRCLAKGGRFIEIGKFDLVSNNALDVHLLEKGAQYKGLALDKLVQDPLYHKFQVYNKMVDDLLHSGAIKPLPALIYEAGEVEQAFRFMGTGNHIGKILIKLRNEEDQKICQVPKKVFSGLARFSCKPESSYLVLGGLGGFGLELADWLVIRGAKKLVLTSKSGLTNGYQKYRIRFWKNYGVEIITSTIDASTAVACTELIKIANGLGPVDGIFNLGVVLKDALFENQTVEDFITSFIPKAKTTRHLDSISRSLCPNLRCFVTFSSISCGLGNAGQTNYGMSNSIMERICEKRKREGYPALAIQWGAVGDVGLVAKMQEDNKELVIGGTLQQGIASCLKVMDKMLVQNDTIVTSMVVAEKKYGATGDDLYETILNALGITNTSSMSIHSTFAELGMDSIVSVEIKQIFERDYELFLTPMEIRSLTPAKLKELSDELLNKSENAQIEEKDRQTDIDLLLHFIGNEEHANIPVMKMETLVAANENAPNIYILPGLEGTSIALEPLCKKLKAHVSCLQFCNGNDPKTIEDMALSLYPHIDQTEDELIIIAYSYGTIVAVEIIRLLEAAGRTCRVIFIDGSYEFIYHLLNRFFPSDDVQMLQILYLSHCMKKYTFGDFSKAVANMTSLETFEEKADYLISLSPEVDVSKEYLRQMCISNFIRIMTIFKYKPSIEKLNSKVILFKPMFSLVELTADDYNLSTIFKDPVDVVKMDGDHVSVLENDELSDRINEIIKLYVHKG